MDDLMDTLKDELARLMDYRVNGEVTVGIYIHYTGK